MTGSYGPGVTGGGSSGSSSQSGAPNSLTPSITGGDVRALFITATPEEVAALHGNSDLDITGFSHHHTLGKSYSQASPGNHIHDGTQSLELPASSIPNIEELTNYPGAMNTTLEGCWDFWGGVTGTTINDSPFTTFLAGAGSGISGLAALDTRHPGLLNCVTGTTATGRAGIFSSPGMMQLGGGEVVVEWIVQFGFLSNGANEFVFQCGLMDNAAADQVDGVYFEYDRAATIADVWRICASSASVRTKTVTIKTIAAGTWYRLKLVVNAAGTEAQFFVDDVSVGTVSSNVPNGTGKEVGLGANMIKSVGVGSRNFIPDKCYFRQILTTAR